MKDLKRTECNYKNNTKFYNKKLQIKHYSQQLQKLISIEEHQKVVKVLKVWQPKPLLPIFHVVYKIIIKLEIKKKLAKVLLKPHNHHYYIIYFLW